MHSTKVAQSASKPEDVWQQVLWEINSQQIQTTEVKSQEMMGGEDLFLSLLRLLFRLSRDPVELLRTALSTVTRQGEDPFDGVGCSNYPAIVGVVRTFAQAQSDQWFNIVSIFFVPSFSMKRAIKRVKPAIPHNFPQKNCL